MRSFEAIFLVYLVYLAALAAGNRPVPLSRDRRWRVCAWLGAGGGAVLAAQRLRGGWGAGLRDLMPFCYILIGYRSAGLFFVRPSPRIETWLEGVDARLGIARLAARQPGPLAAYLEASYLGIHLLIPAGLAALCLGAGRGSAQLFWNIVLSAELICYGCLPWIQTRPPRLLRAAPAPPRGGGTLIQRANLFVLRHGGLEANTFPSGHAAGALAVSLAVGSLMPAVGLVFLLAAASVAAGAVLGRYHYTVDSVAGALLAVLVWAVVGLG